MKNVVYILGAGFSRPLGIPVMSEFYEASRDLFYNNQDKYHYFADVFSDIKLLSSTKNYYQANLFNIEEILSIFEMQSFNEEPAYRTRFVKYVTDVVSATMTPLQGHTLGTVAFWANLFPGVKWPGYAIFFSSMFGFRFNYNRLGQGEVRTDYIVDLQTKYDILTLNIDLVPETFIAYMNQNRPAARGIKFNDDNQRPVGLHKLHGSIDGEIIPPTWNKFITSAIIKDAWTKGLEALSKANHIRIIGYSLPETDSYIRYLFKTSGIKAPDLRSIDIICLDPEKTVQARYDQFIRFHRCRFFNVDAKDYLDSLQKITKQRAEGSSGTFECQYLEQAHEEFVQQQSKNCIYLRAQ